MSTLTFRTHGIRSIDKGVQTNLLLIAAGVIAVSIPRFVGLGVDFAVCGFLLLSAFVHVRDAWKAHPRKGVALELVLAALYGLVGAFLLLLPTVGVEVLTLGLVVYLVSKGVVDCARWYLARSEENSEWTLMEGLFTIVIAVIVGVSWPESSDWAIGLLLGAGMLIVGVLRLLMPTIVKHFMSRPEPDEPQDQTSTFAKFP